MCISAYQLYYYIILHSTCWEWNTWRKLWAVQGRGTKSPSYFLKAERKNPKFLVKNKKCKAATKQRFWVHVLGCLGCLDVAFFEVFGCWFSDFFWKNPQVVFSPKWAFQNPRNGMIWFARVRGMMPSNAWCPPTISQSLLDACALHLAKVPTKYVGGWGWAVFFRVGLVSFPGRLEWWIVHLGLVFFFKDSKVQSKCNQGINHEKK